MDNLKIKEAEIEKAKKSLDTLQKKIAKFPGYNLETIFDRSQGQSVEELKKMFNELNELKECLVTSIQKTHQALDVIKNDFNAFDKTFAKKFQEKEK